MSAITLPTKGGGFRVLFPAVLLDSLERAYMVDAHWSETHTVRPEFNRWDLGWLVGRYVHADRANRNGHIFPLEDLKAAYPMVRHTPLNVLHRPREIIGHFAEAELLYPPNGEPAQTAVPVPATYNLPPAADEVQGNSYPVIRRFELPPAADEEQLPTPPDPPTPWVETLAVVYRSIFPNMYDLIQRATARGVASLSMEAFPEMVGCGTCGAEYPHDGPTSETYTCGHLDTRGAPKRLIRPHFVGGAVVLPPARPGWREASIKKVAALWEQDPDTAADIHEQIAESWTVADDKMLEEAMAAIVASSDLLAPEPKPVTATKLPDDDPVKQMAEELAAMLDSQSSTGDFSFRIPDDLVLPTVWEARGYAIPVGADGEMITIDGDPEQIAAQIAAQLQYDQVLQDQATGAVIAVYPPADIAATLAAAGGEPVEAIHMTVVSLGKIADLDYTAEDVVAAVKAAVEGASPIDARITGVGRFRLEGPAAGTEATVALIDAPGVNALHEALTGALQDAGLVYSQKYGFIPHITLAYHNPGDGPDEIPAPSPWTISEIHVAWGDEHTVVPFGDVSRA